jgi:predicted ATPase/DNA-binding winged helix-turn-helix (wHTH) protein
MGADQQRSSVSLFEASAHSHGRAPAPVGDKPLRCATEQPVSFTFRRFQVSPHRRELLAGGVPVKLGGRAFDVLLALIDAPGAVLGKDALMTRVWPDRIVEENALQAQIMALRAAFGPDRDLIRTVTGRGYQFVGEVLAVPGGLEVRSAGERATVQSPSVVPSTNLPEPISELVGRDGDVREVLGLAAAHRLVTLTGPGGIGKTRLAIAVARELVPQFADGVWFAELAPLSDPELVPPTVAAAARLEFPAGAASPDRVIEALRGKQLLLVLDNCEHVIDAAARMAEALLRANPMARVIVTTREPLKVDGEWAYLVAPLAVPAEESDGEDDFLRYDAVRLFVERARAADPHFAPHPPQMAMIAAICRRLDGVPLAIELAAARTAAFGVEPLAGRADDLFALLTGGRRTAPHRHQSLRGALEWSYRLLSECERIILRRLAVFHGAFTLEAAMAVVAEGDIPAAKIIVGLADLVSKSLIASGAGRGGQYRLLGATRAYLLDKLGESGERERVAGRHAEYGRQVYEPAEAELALQPPAERPGFTTANSATCARRSFRPFRRAVIRLSA